MLSKQEKELLEILNKSIDSNKKEERVTWLKSNALAIIALIISVIALLKP